MPRPLPRDRWLAGADERFTTLDAWRQAHPTATWAVGGGLDRGLP